MTDSPSVTHFYLAEYQALRDEILKRTDIQHQLISISLVSFATLVSIAFTGPRESTLLVYPLLSVFLSAVWSYNDLRIRQIGIYIRDRIEKTIVGTSLGWEHAITGTELSNLIGSRTILATRGILIGTQVFAIILFVINRSGQVNTPSEIALVILDISVVLFTLVLLRRQDVSKDELSEKLNRSGKPEDKRRAENHEDRRHQE